MKLERIGAVVQALGSREQPARQFAPGERLLLKLAQAGEEAILAATSNGTTFRLAGLQQALGDLKAGDLLHVRVLASEPSLELEIEGAVPRRLDAGAEQRDNGSPLARQASMRLDQAALRQIVWQKPDPAALAQSWRNLALARWGRPSATTELLQQPPTAAPVVIVQPPVREPPSVLPPPGLERWLFPVYAWGGARIMLGLTAEEDSDERPQPRRQRSLRLCVGLSPVALGEIVLQAQWNAQGFELRIVVKESASVQPVRQALPKIAESLMRAGIGLVYVAVVHEQRVVAYVGNPMPNASQSTVVSLLSLLSFRALAEAVFVLLQVTPDANA